MIPLFKVAMAENVHERVAEVLHSGYVGQGPRVEEFEARFQALVDAPVRPVTVNSGTSSIDLALYLCGVGPGDEVITPPMTCVATQVHIVHRQARIVWADVDPLTGLIDPRDVAVKVTPRTKAILAVDWGGAPCDYDVLKQFGVPVIEDAAHALLARYRGESIARTGGDFVCWSFQAIKHLTAVDGGALLCPPSQVDRAKLLRWYGLDRDRGDAFRCSQDIVEAGWKYHMNDVSAAIGLANLPHAESVVRAHRENAQFYCETLREAQGVQVPRYNADSSWWLYTIHTPERDRFIRHMAEHEIMASPVHARTDKHTAFRKHYSGPLPGVTRFSDSEVAIPVGWWLSNSERDRIVEAVFRWRLVC
jgi:dTDP-4-amino-4,6-dideoxygalactose transaminase